MIKSMTGFGRQTIEAENNLITLEIRTLNSKQLDLTLRNPVNYKEKELDVRNLITVMLERGKIDVTINFEKKSTESAAVINTELAVHYFEELKTLSGRLGLKNENDLLPIVMKMPDVLASQQEEINPEEWQSIIDGLKKTCELVDAFRLAEGKLIETVFISGIRRILELLNQVEPFEAERVTKIKERILTNLNSLMKDTQADKNRLEQEMIYYVEKLDISEEKMRLKKHCDYFLEILTEKESQGKKLGFISQEIGREINTLGAKANDVDIQKIVVLMKDELEKIKEQLANVL